MSKWNCLSRVAFGAALVAGLVFGLSLTARAASPAPQQDQAAVSAAESQLNKKQFHEVKVTVENGIATLTGKVELYEFKSEAERHVRHAKGVTAVRNLIEVGGPAIEDKALESKLQEKLTYDRIGYGNVFNAIGVKVENGVAFLGGHARTYVDKDSALALVSTTAGVKDVVDQIEVDPVSLMDDQTRFAVARAIYGFPMLNRYAIDPAKPIRISVQNGNVELYGTVDTQAEKDAVNIRANSVAGVFSVKNYLQVAGKQAEH
ncbi:MAG: BON domain-containing protein [Terracidiphilus sp.]|nr:BON domain-containing protein [Terracidiphilus sp.]